MQYNTTDLWYHPSSSAQKRTSRLGIAYAFVIHSIAGEELAQGPNAAARAEFKNATLRTEGTDPTTELQRPTYYLEPTSSFCDQQSYTKKTI